MHASNITSSDTTWQWYCNGQLLPGETRPLIKGTAQTGTFHYKRITFVDGKATNEFRLTLKLPVSAPSPSTDTVIFVTANAGNLPFTGGSSQFSLLAAKPWEVTATPDWLSVSPMSGGGSSEYQLLTLTALPFNGTAPRQGNIVVTQNGKQYSWKVTQNNSPSYVEGYRFMTNGLPLDNPLRIPARGASSTWRWNAAGSFGWYNILKQADWLSFRSSFAGDPQSFRGNDEVYMTCDENLSGEPRVTSFFVRNYDDTCLIYTVIQEGATDYLDLPFTTLEARAKGEKQTLTVISNQVWTAIPSENWLTVEKKESDSHKTPLELTVAPNSGAERTGRIDFQSASGQVIKTIEISQHAYIPLAYPFNLPYKIKLKAFWATASFHGMNGGIGNYANCIIYTSKTYPVPLEAEIRSSNLYGFVTDAPQARYLETAVSSDVQFYIPAYQGNAVSCSMDVSITWNSTVPYLRRCNVTLPVPASLTTDDELTFLIEMYDINNAWDFKYKVTTEAR